MKRRRQAVCVSRSAALVHATAFALATGLSGCQVGPDYERPITVATSDDAADAFTQPHRRTSSSSDNRSDWDAATEWWKRFSDPTLVDLVNAAIEHNQDLAAARARVVEADAVLRQATGARRPAIGGSSSASRSFNTINDDRVYANNFELGANVSWEADLFGKLRRAERAAAADAFASDADRVALQHAIIAAVVRARVAIATSERQLQLQREIVASRAQTLRVVERRLDRGVEGTGLVDVYLARENLEAARAEIPREELRRTQSAHALNVLIGRTPGTSDDLTQNAARVLPSVPPVSAPALGPPADLLDRRPDLQSSEFRLMAATERVGVAIADLYPGLRLRASAGNRSEDLEDLFSVDSLFASIAADLTVRLFEGGRIRAGIDAARARVDASIASYRAGILTAIQEVEDALAAESLGSDRLARLTARADAARAAEKLASERFGSGLETLLRLLETERRRSNADTARIQAEADLWNARINLFLAIGGDWMPPAEVSDPATTPPVLPSDSEPSS